MRRLILAALTTLALAACAGGYVGGDVGARRLAEPVSSR